MIARYTRPELGRLWTDAGSHGSWREVELAACEELPGLLGEHGPSDAELQAIRAATFTVEAVNERERTTDHDVAAFVDVLGDSAGEAGRWIHYGLTSSDVLDTALALQLRAAGEIVVRGRARAGRRARGARARTRGHADRVGRTHGVHAEPTTFGVKLAGLAFEAHRNARRLERAFAQAQVGALSGTVGTYAATSPEYERARAASASASRARTSRRRSSRATATPSCSARSRSPARVSSASRPRSATCSAPRCARSRSRFAPGRRAPRRCRTSATRSRAEQISGLARVLRGNAQAALENVALWHERDISHSSVERIVLPDSTILLDYMQHRAISLVRGLIVDAERMRGTSS